MAPESMLNCQLYWLYVTGTGEKKNKTKKPKPNQNKEQCVDKSLSERRGAGLIEEKLGRVELEVEVSGLTPQPSRESFFP